MVGSPAQQKMNACRQRDELLGQANGHIGCETPGVGCEVKAPKLMPSGCQLGAAWGHMAEAAKLAAGPAGALRLKPPEAGLADMTEV